MNESRSLAWFDAIRFSALDFRLGARMLLRYPGLTMVGSLAMGVAIALGAGVLAIIAQVDGDRLPLPGGDRIVSIQMLNVRLRRPDRRVLGDFMEWRNRLTSVEHLGAFWPLPLNVIAPDGSSEPVRAAEMTASAFRVARVAPLLGRYFTDEDDKAGAAPVAVLGYTLWRSRFAADSLIIGKQVRLGTTMHTIIGVMPDGFAFPTNISLWIPYVVDPLRFDARDAIYVLGRLAPEASRERAQAELNAIAPVMRQRFPETHADLRPRLLSLQHDWWDLESSEARLAIAAGRATVMFLLIVITVNLAILVYARTATRVREITVRSALGASRARIVAQLFGEGLVLSAIGVAVGLSLLWITMRELAALAARMELLSIPFWIRVGISGETVAWIVILAVAGAAVIGILPALQITGRHVHVELQRLGSGHSSVRLGRTWTAMIVTEFAIAVAVLPTALFFTMQWVKAVTVTQTFPAQAILSARLTMDREISKGRPPESGRDLAERFVGARDELLRRVRADAGVIDASYAREAPGGEDAVFVELDSIGTPDATPMDMGRGADGYRVRLARIDIGYFRTFDAPLIAGRPFVPSDADTAARTVIVNRAFAATALLGRNALGRRVRALTYTDSGIVRGPWLEIVGTVGDFPLQQDIDRPTSAVYRATGSARLYPTTLAIRTRDADAATFAPRLREVTAAVSPSLQLREVMPVSAALRLAQAPLRLMALGMLAVTLSVVLLSAAGIYALMSVTVTQRRREIGIRIALGADRRRILTGVFAGSLGKLVLGVVIGMSLAGVVRAFGGGLLTMLPIVALMALAIGSVATLGPARRALRIQPTELLKDE